jgi:hypothetical protein
MPQARIADRNRGRLTAGKTVHFRFSGQNFTVFVIPGSRNYFWSSVQGAAWHQARLDSRCFLKAPSDRGAA